MKLMTWSAGKWRSTRMRCRCLAILRACSTAPASLLTSTSVFLRSFSIGYSFRPFEGSQIIVFHDTLSSAPPLSLPAHSCFQIFVVELQSDACHSQGRGTAGLLVRIALALSFRLMLFVSASKIF
jgi:hypothetical protein